MPDFYTDGNTPRIGDTLYRTTMKILGALVAGAGSVGSYSAGGNFSGTGSPEGVVTANKGATYVDTNAPGSFYYKTTDGSNTGWV